MFSIPRASRSSPSASSPDARDDERRAPEISPVYADLAGLPPCLLSVGTCDHLFDDTILFATRAAAVGVDVELVVLPEMPHAFMLYSCGITEVVGGDDRGVVRRTTRRIARNYHMSVTVEDLRRLLAAFNAHDLDTVMSWFADDCILEMPQRSRTVRTQVARA